MRGRPGECRHAEWVENRPRSRLPRLDVRELWAYRELAGFLALRDVRVRYKQALLGAGWAIFQPLAGVVVFTIVFRRLAAVDSDGLPYPVFVFVGLVVWTYTSGAVIRATQSLVANVEPGDQGLLPAAAHPARRRAARTARPGGLAARAGDPVLRLRRAARVGGADLAAVDRGRGDRRRRRRSAAVGDERALPRRQPGHHAARPALAVPQPGRLPRECGVGGLAAAVRAEPDERSHPGLPLVACSVGRRPARGRWLRPA